MGDCDDYEDWPDDAEWCDRCQGMGIANCYCGGDQCYCENCGEMECPQCGGEGIWVPTEAQKKAHAELAEFMRAVWAAEAIEARTGQDPEGLDRNDESADRKASPETPLKGSRND